ncbi:alpha/beta fold hydrolase [Aquabacterium sp. A7-Y]|uniref:alpha/beta hydrolase family protein n=1 Tax=Aquabacterium sp. A7-Y TaxID=1349605 RepID=UPI00223CA568|nr:alpha/beta fold hydrolase [Aquabacterium sp. A7-Y]MCW7541678.1 alpha/beta fold hydrolase [Aquabacterium sp. A7-Y]
MDATAPELIEYCARDGARASLRAYRADHAAAPVVICLPAMGVKGAFYTDLALALRQGGVHAVLSDLRGVDTSSVRASRACDFGYDQVLRLDLPALTEKVHECFPASRRWLLGHSLGGQLSALYLSVQPEAADGLILIAACNVHHKGWSGLMRWRVLGTTLLFRSLGTLLGYVPAGRFGFAGNEARTMVRDWSNNCLTGRYEIVNGTHDYERSLRQLTKPVLAISFELDRLAPRASVENLLRKLENAPVTRRHFAPDATGLEKASHFNWAKRPQVVVQTIQAWMHRGQVLDPAPTTLCAQDR